MENLMTNHKTTLILTALACTLLLVRTEISFASENCAELLTNKCISCHSMDRVCQKLGKKNEKRWKRTVKRMVKRGTKLTKTELKDVVICLAEQSPGTLQVCKCDVGRQTSRHLQSRRHVPRLYLC